MLRRSIGLGACLALAGAVSLVTPVSAQDAGDGPHPAHIHVGVCPEPGDIVAPLTDVMAGTEASEGLATAIAVEVSNTTVDMALPDILAAEHSINVHESADAIDVYIACGDLGGPVMLGTDLAIGLAELNESGHAGVAWLHDNGDGTTTVNGFLTAPGGATPAPESTSAAG